MSLCAVARADYGYMTFVTGSGTTTLSVADMQMTVDGANLAVTYNSGSQNFVLTDLQSMYFSDEQGITGLNEASIDADSAVRVFTLTGAEIGTYPTLRNAVENLLKGSYVIRQNANSQKIIVK